MNLLLNEMILSYIYCSQSARTLHTLSYLHSSSLAG